jgi:hypothetical protein
MKMKTMKIDTEEQESDFRDTVLELLYVGVQDVTFTKKDGTQRTLVCTLRPDLIPRKDTPLEGEGVNVRSKSSTDSINVFETDLQEWRAFNMSNVIAIKNHQEVL